MNTRFTRSLDLVAAISGLILSSPVLAVILIAGAVENGSPIFLQKRVGKHRRPFVLVKFRTMPINTASVGTHLADSSSIRPLGRFLRRTKLDELPQLINVLKGEMSLVGPRPCLPNQKELIHEREQRGVYRVLPGITGLAQVNNIDMSTPQTLAEWDQRMIETFSMGAYLKYILQTAIGQGGGDRVAPS